MPAPQGFIRKVKDRAAPTQERKSVSFFLETTDEDEDGNEIVILHEDYTATMPTEEQLMLVFAEGGKESATMADEAAAMLDVFKAALPDAEYRRLYKRLKNPNDKDVDFELLQDLFAFLMEQWQDFPTTPPVGSSPSPSSTGGRSTGRVRGKGSIPST